MYRSSPEPCCWNSFKVKGTLFLLTRSWHLFLTSYDWTVLNDCVIMQLFYSIMCSCHTCPPLASFPQPTWWFSHLPLGPHSSHCTSCWLWRKEGQGWVEWAVSPVLSSCGSQTLKGEVLLGSPTARLYNVLVVKAGSDARVPAVLVTIAPGLAGTAEGDGFS